MPSLVRTVAAIARRIAPVTAATAAEQALLGEWLRSTQQDGSAVVSAIADAAVDAALAHQPAATVAELRPWVDAELQSFGRANTRGRAQWRRTPSSIRRWVIAAKAGDVLAYHIGELARDRLLSPVLHAVAEYIAALADLGAVRATATRTTLPNCSVYLAHRARGHAKHPLVLGVVSPAEWRALVALADRPANVAAGKWLERRMLIGAAEASALIASMLGSGLLRRTAESRGVDLSERGRAVLKGA